MPFESGGIEVFGDSALMLLPAAATAPWLLNSPEWAAERCGIGPDTVRSLALTTAIKRTLFTVTW